MVVVVYKFYFGSVECESRYIISLWLYHGYFKSILPQDGRIVGYNLSADFPCVVLFSNRSLGCFLPGEERQGEES